MFEDKCTRGRTGTGPTRRGCTATSSTRSGRSGGEQASSSRRPRARRRPRRVVGAGFAIALALPQHAPFLRSSSESQFSAHDSTHPPHGPRTQTSLLLPTAPVRGECGGGECDTEWNATRGCDKGMMRHGIRATSPPWTKERPTAKLATGKPLSDLSEAKAKGEMTSVHFPGAPASARRWRRGDARRRAHKRQTPETRRRAETRA